MTKKNLKVAVTGGIGSGKSLFSNFLIEKNYPVIFADDISRELLENDPVTKKQIIKEFGGNAYKNGNADKLFLADKVFSDSKNLLILNSILHPKVIDKIQLLMKDYLMKNKIVFVEAALIYEAEIEKLFDFVVLIIAEEKIRLKRSVKDRKITEEEFNRRNKNQIRDEEKMKRADFILYNNTTKKDLKQKADLLLYTLNSLL